MDKQELKEKIKEFLAKHHITDGFETNTRNCWAMDLDSYLNLESVTQCKEDLIASAFPWGLTTEGHEFWQELDDKWLEELKELEYNSKKR